MASRIKYGPAIRDIGKSSTRCPSANGSHIFSRIYEKCTHVSGDVRGVYQDLIFNGQGGGETLRIRAIANALLVATGATVNAMHATMQVAAGKTISGAAHAIRATLEVAGTTPTPGGTLSALQVDSNISTGWTAGGKDAFISIANVGAGKLTNVLQVPTAAAKTAYLTDPFVARHADPEATHGLKMVDAAGTVYWIMVTTDTPND